MVSLTTTTTPINLGRRISSSVNKQPKVRGIERLAKQQHHKTSPELAVLSVMCFSGPDNILTWYLSQRTSQREEIRDQSSVLIFQFIFHSLHSLSPFSTFLFTSTLWWIVELLNFPSSGYHPVWVGRIFHTAFGLRSVEHLGHRTKYRTGMRRQTQPPAAISSQAILIAGVAVWVIPSVIHYEALSLFPAQ